MNRFSFPLFQDATLQEEIASTGFAVRPCLNENQISELLEKYKALFRLLPNGLPDLFCPSGRFEDPSLRNFARDSIESVVPQSLKSFFNERAASLMGGTFLIKPPGPNTGLSPHQDSSHVDESESFSVYAWIPLVDTTIENGALHVISGSHLWGNKHRSLNVPWCFSGHEQELMELSEPVLMKAGFVCFFEGALVHSSPPNQTEHTRVALNYFIKPINQPFLHHYIDEETPTGKVEVYGVDIDFFYSDDFESRPPTNAYVRNETRINELALVKKVFGIKQ